VREFSVSKEYALERSEMNEAKKVLITSWSALLRCSSCGNEEVSIEYGNWTIDSTTIKHCPICKRTTNHKVVGLIADMVEWNKVRQMARR
jgi:hypothetical protein